MRPVRWLAMLTCYVTLVQAQEEVDSEESRKVLGSSVVTSVSVIMDHGNGTKTYIADAAGQPVDQTDGAVGSPVDLLNPDRYEFYTFDETGDLVKRLMTLDQIKGLLAGGDGETLDSPSNSPTYYHESLAASHLDDSYLEPNMAQGVHSVVASVQNVLRSELEASKTKVTTSKPLLNIPDSLSSWSMLFPPILSDSSESLDDGNSVNEPIDIVDRLPSPSNEEKTQVKVSQDNKTSVTSKPTAVPPIIHFLEIQSVPSPLKSPTKIPSNALTTPATIATTSAPPSTTIKQKLTSPINPIQEMSASISSLLSQVTDNKSSTDILSSSENRISISTASPSTTESATKVSNAYGTKVSEKNPILIKPLKSESSNINVVTKKPQETHSKTESPTIKNKPMKVTEIVTNKFSKPNMSTTPSTAAGSSKVAANQSSTKKTTDAVVSMITTSKPSQTATKTNHLQINKSKPANSVYGTKQKLQVTTPSTLPIATKNNIKNQSTTQSNAALSKKPKPAVTLSKPGQGSETLEAHGSEGVVKIVPNKPSQIVSVNNKIRPNSVNKTNSSGTDTKVTAKPHKKVPTNNSSDCGSTNKTHSQHELKTKEKLEVAASASQVDKVKPTKVKTPIQEIKIAPKPSVQNNKSSLTKNKPSDDVKITTYKPSTHVPFTTKHSKNKISTTTEQSLDHLQLESMTKIHEVNSSLLDIKDHIVNIQNKNKTQSKPKLPALSLTKTKANLTKYEGAASSTSETKVSVKTNDSSIANKNITEIIDHSTEAECTHRKKPVHTSIQDKISDLSHDFAASNAEEVKLTTTSEQPTTEIATESPSGKDTTTDVPLEVTTKESDDLATTTDLSDESVTELPETTTLIMPEMDLVKEGISAVTNILLDTKPALEPQLPIPTLPLSESASSLVHSPPVKGELKHASSFDEMEMTTADTNEENITNSIPSTEKELIIYFTSTLPPITETVPPTTEESGSNKSSISSEESTEQVPEAETVTPKTDETTTQIYEEIENKESSESKIISLAAVRPVLPTKESKLSPEQANETLSSTEASPLCNHSITQHNKTNEYPTVLSLDKNVSKENLIPAQSVISEINKTKQENSPTTPETVLFQTTQKNTLKDDSFNLDYKAAIKPDQSIKFNPVKYPNLQSSFRPGQDPIPVNPSTAVELHPAPHESMGLEATTAFLADDVRRFSDLCNELAFRMWTSITGKGSISSRSLVLSPFATTSLLAMVFLGARGPTSGQMNDVLRLDDMVTFNPHQVLQNVTESVLNSRNYGVTTAAFVRELYSDKIKGKILDFYKERAQQYYDGHVEEISFNNIGDILRRRTNLLVKRQTLGRIPEYLRGSTLSLRPPLAAFSANIFQTDCDLASTEGRDGEMYFVVRPSTRQRRLVPVPAAVWRTGFLAGYEPGLDATAVALGTDSVVSTILVLPGQQGQVAPGDGLARLEQRLIETSYRRGGWTRMLRSLLPRPGLELQVPRFSHRSVLNVTSTLQRMGLKDLFNENKADLRGLNGLSNDLHLSDMVQVNTFSTCGEDTIGARHHIETYPVSPQRMGRDDPELYPRPEDYDHSDLLRVPLNLRPRQARLPDNPRLRFDRPFIYMVRHNPTGMILHMGRFNPRLLP